MFKFLKEKFSGWLGKKKNDEIESESDVGKEAKVLPKAKSSASVGEKKSLKKTKPSKEKKVTTKNEGSVTEVVRENADEIRKEVAASEKEFEKDEVVERAKELEEKIEKPNNDLEEPLGKEEIENEIEEKKGFFGFLAKKLTTSELTEGDFDSAFDDLEMTLLENNVALGVVDKIKESLRKDLVGKRFGKKEADGKIIAALKSAIEKLLIEPLDIVQMIRSKKDGPFVILFFGINGSGKTTSIAKLAWKLKSVGLDSVLAAGDTFRAASIEQLETHAQKIGVEIVKGDYGKDPASVAFDAISHAKREKKKVVLIDTAGRMYTKQNLMREMEKIVKVSQPDLKIFVGESITGNDATEQARMFNETAGIDGIILSKADVDEKAGTILSVSFVTGKPIYFLGIGQEYSDLQEFSKKNVLKGLGLE